MNANPLAPRAAAVLGTLALASCPAGGRPPADDPAGPPRDELVQRFEGAPGALPGGWRVGTSSAGGDSADARWELSADPTAPSPPGTLALVDARGHAGSAYNLCWIPAPVLADVEVSVAVHADGGVEDQGGGPAWRIAGADDYYLARWNPLEDNFRVYSVTRGERRQLDGAEVRADAGAWHTIRVRHRGAAITCWFDGEELLHAEDGALPDAGAVGLWTKADATTRFDDLTARPAR